MNSPRRVSVIIPTYYRYGCLGDLLDALSRQTTTPDEVIVPDQTPLEDRPAGFYQQFEGKLPLKVMDIAEPSLTAPRNRAAEQAIGDILLLLDDDTVVGDDLIEAHLRVMDREQVDVVNGAVSLQKELPESYPGDMTGVDPVRFFLAAPNYRWNGMQISVSSCNFSIKTELFMAVGGFDESLPRMVDFELGYRLYRHGAKIYFSEDPFVVHLRAPGGSRKKPDRHDRLVAALYIHKKHFPGWITKQFVLKQLHDSIWNRRVLVRPWSPFVRASKLIRANRIVNKKLREARRPNITSLRND